MRPQLPALLCLTLSLPCAAWDVRTDSEGDLVLWTKPLEMILDSRAATQLHDAHAEDAIRAAFQNLDDATPFLEVSVRVGEAKPIGYVPGRADNQNSILVLEDWPYSEDALAVTLVTLNARTNELLDADVAFNIRAHHFRVLPDEARDERRFDDVQNTITHELGHVLGLMHNADTEDLVMYPSAPPGEVCKRVLKADDRDGLLSMYGTAPEPKTAPPLVGCSSSSAPPAWWVVVMMLLVVIRRGVGQPSPRPSPPRGEGARFAALLALVPAIGLGAEPLPAAVTRADEVALVEVASGQSSRHPRQPGLIITELTITPVECLKGVCGGLARVTVAGGRVGDLEQIAVHEPVPAPGQRVLVTRSAGLVRVLWVEPDVQALIIKALRATAGWASTQGAEAPPVTPRQVPAIRP